MSRRMQHIVLKDTETGGFPDLRALLNSVLNCFRPGSWPVNSLIAEFKRALRGRAEAR